MVVQVIQTGSFKRDYSTVRGNWVIYRFFYVTQFHNIFICREEDWKIENEKVAQHKKMYSRKDSNFGWLIVAASFLSHFFQYGIVWTVGVFYVIFLEHIRGSSGAVALISSLNTAMFYSTGNVIDYSFIQNINF